jgi:hypothetical protein
VQPQIKRVTDPFERTCKVCGHLKVCAVFRAVGPLLSNNWEDESRPFDPESLATICKEFLSASTIEMLREAQ